VLRAVLAGLPARPVCVGVDRGVIPASPLLDARQVRTVAQDLQKAQDDPPVEATLRTQEAGFNGHLIKPVSREVVISQVARLLGASTPSRSTLSPSTSYRGCGAQHTDHALVGAQPRAGLPFPATVGVGRVFTFRSAALAANLTSVSRGSHG
jgi:hypothetical protein